MPWVRTDKIHRIYADYKVRLTLEPDTPRYDLQIHGYQYQDQERRPRAPHTWDILRHLLGLKTHTHGQRQDIQDLQEIV